MTDSPLLSRCHDAWSALEPFRRERLECKRHAYGTSGAPVPNNLIRQLIKSVVGRYRFLRGGAKIDLDAEARAGLDTDAATLEEFLISGMALNRVDGPRCRPLSPESIFFSRFAEADGSDAIFAGCLLEMDRGELLRRFAGGDMERASALLDIYRGGEAPAWAPPTREAATDFMTPTLPGRLRVIEVWERRSVEVLGCHDTLHAEYVELPYSDGAAADLAALGRSRRRDALPPVELRLESRDCWRRTFLSPSGRVLARSVHSPDEFPFVMRLYPMTDGETHSLVADVLPQQKHINRLVELLDRVIDRSAKGVLLFPTEQLPDGFTWADMRRIWADPGGILPYRRTSRQVAPTQVHSSGWNQGAADMLRMQIDLFAEVSGLSPSFRGQAAKYAGHDAALVDAQNSNVALLDMLSAFHSFIAARDRRLCMNR